MRKFLSVLAVAIFVVGCNQQTAAVEEKKEDAAAKTAAKKDSSYNYAFKALYSSSFEMGDPKNAKIVLDIWKAYQDNKMEDTKAFWADSVTLQFANGFTFRGSPDSVVAGGKGERSNYTALTDSVDAWISTKSLDRNEEWVCVWGREYSTNKKGKKDTTSLQEIWRLKEGKVNFMAQFTAHHK